MVLRGASSNIVLAKPPAPVRRLCGCPRRQRCGDGFVRNWEQAERSSNKYDCEYRRLSETTRETARVSVRLPTLRFRYPSKEDERNGRRLTKRLNFRSTKQRERVHENGEGKRREQAQQFGRNSNRLPVTGKNRNK